MNTKDRVLNLLQLHSENSEAGTSYLSGAEIAEQIGVSRTAVWKAIKTLEKEGYAIDGVSNKGYRIVSSGDILSEKNIERYLEEKDAFAIKVFDEIDSTNTALKIRGGQGDAEGTVYVAKAQTAGRGRMDRTFKSESETGAYFSILLRPKMSPEEALKITTIAAVAVIEAIENVTGKKAGIKWVNDIILNDKKVCGILTEASFNMETGFLDYAVLGIGINVFDPKGGWPKELENVAGAVMADGDKQIEDLKSRLVAQTLNSFWRYYKKLPEKDYIDSYKEKSVILGSDVYIIRAELGQKGSVDEIVKDFGDELPVAKAVDIDDNLGLVVEFADGSRQVLSTGEVSVRKVKK